MTMRMMVVLGMVLVGPALAQPPSGAPTAPPTAPPPPPAEGSSSIVVAPPVDEHIAGPGPRPGVFWFSAEYLLGHISGADLPGLVTTSPPGTTRALAGLIGAPGTQVLFGGMVNTDVRSGFRI